MKARVKTKQEVSRSERSWFLVYFPLLINIYINTPPLGFPLSRCQQDLFSAAEGQGHGNYVSGNDAASPAGHLETRHSGSLGTSS